MGIIIKIKIMTNEIYRAKQMEVYFFYLKDKNEIKQTKKDKKRMKFLKIMDLINKNRLLLATKMK